MSKVETSAVEMMRHAIGHMSRNYYCVEVGGPEWSQWSGLVTLGLAHAGFTINDGRDRNFHLTAEGFAYLEKLGEPKAKKKARRK